MTVQTCLGRPCRYAASQHKSKEACRKIHARRQSALELIAFSSTRRQVSLITFLVVEVGTGDGDDEREGEVSENAAVRRRGHDLISCSPNAGHTTHACLSVLPASNWKRGTYAPQDPTGEITGRGVTRAYGSPTAQCKFSRQNRKWLAVLTARLGRLSSDTSRRIRLPRVNDGMRGGRRRSKVTEAFSVFRKPVKNLLHTIHLQQHSPSFSGEPGNWNLLLHNPGVKPGGALQSPPDRQRSQLQAFFFLCLSPRKEKKKEEGGRGQECEGEAAWGMADCSRTRS